MELQRCIYDWYGPFAFRFSRGILLCNHYFYIHSTVFLEWLRPLAITDMNRHVTMVHKVFYHKGLQQVYSNNKYIFFSFLTKLMLIFIIITGVVETGLFVNMAKKVYFGMEDGSVAIKGWWPLNSDLSTVSMMTFEPWPIDRVVWISSVDLKLSGVCYKLTK